MNLILKLLYFIFINCFFKLIYTIVLIFKFLRLFKVILKIT